MIDGKTTSTREKIEEKQKRDKEELSIVKTVYKI